MSSKVKYNYELLKSFCQVNELNIIDKLNISDINCNTIIQDKCINKNCNNYFNKKFHILYKTKIFTCKKCTIDNSKLKIKQTITEKYGVEYVGQINEVKEKKKNTCLNKYGVENVLQSKDIIDKIKETNNLKYIEKNGKPMPSTITNDDKNNLLIKKYGSLNIRNSDYIKNKIKQTVLEKYGVDHISKCKNIQKLKKENSLKKYGVEYPSQHEEISEKIMKNNFKLKEFILPSGEIIKVQGYEHFALNDIINNENINENDIITGVRNVPVIWYNDLYGVKHRHFVDIYIKSQNRCIEVKSLWTIKKENVFLKQKSGIELGYKYEIWVYNEKGIRVNKY
jgi:hypothetical protein